VDVCTREFKHSGAANCLSHTRSMQACNLLEAMGAWKHGSCKHACVLVPYKVQAWKSR
jgi:hypothetical protein